MTKHHFPKIQGLRIRETKRGFLFYFDQPKSKPRRLIPLGSQIHEAINKISEIKKQNFSITEKKVFTFEDASKSYFESSKFKHKKPRTQKDYLMYSSNLLKTFGDGPLDSIKTSHIYQYLEHHKSRAVQCNREISLFSIIYNHARDIGQTENQNPSLNVQKHKEIPKTRYITDFEMSDFLKGSPEIFRLEIDFLYRTGLRISDAKKFLHDDAITMIQKTNSKLQFIQSKELKKTIELLKKLHDKPTLFYHSESYFRTIFIRQRIKTGVDFTIHDIRAKSISDYAEIYGQEEARKFASHSNIQTTLKYIRNRKGVKVKSL